MITPIKYLLQECELCYVLLGKFQTDQLESRVGHYRQLSGSNYLVSVQGRIGNEKVICHIMGLGAPYRKFQSQLQ